MTVAPTSSIYMCDTGVFLVYIIYPCQPCIRIVTRSTLHIMADGNLATPLIVKRAITLGNYHSSGFAAKWKSGVSLAIPSYWTYC